MANVYFDDTPNGGAPQQQLGYQDNWWVSDIGSAGTHLGRFPTTGDTCYLVACGGDGMPIVGGGDTFICTTCIFPINISNGQVAGDYPTGCKTTGALLAAATVASFAGTFTTVSGGTDPACIATFVDVDNSGTFGGTWTGVLTNSGGIIGATVSGSATIVSNGGAIYTVYGAVPGFSNYGNLIGPITTGTGTTLTNYSSIDTYADIIDCRGATFANDVAGTIYGGTIRLSSGNFFSNSGTITNTPTLQIYATVAFSALVVGGFEVDPLIAQDTINGALFINAGGYYTRVISVTDIPRISTDTTAVAADILSTKTAVLINDLVTGTRVDDILATGMQND